MNRETLDLQHEDYTANRGIWDHALAAWDGTGGYRPWVDAVNPSSYGAGSIDTLRFYGTSYIDQHPRESQNKYYNRVRGAVYYNILRAIGETILGFLFRRMPTRKGETDFIASFLENADGLGRSLDEVLQQDVGPRALLFGSCPTLVDRSNVEARNLAEAKEAGASTHLVTFYPQDLYDWQTDDYARLVGAKFVGVSQRGDFLDEIEEMTVARVWTPDDWQIWEMDKISEPAQKGQSTHPVGEVPVAIARFANPQRPTILGTTFMREVASINRAIFNRVSELHDHLRNQVFALLVIPSDKDISGIKAGTDNAIPLRANAGGAWPPMPAYLAPPESVARTLFDAIEKLRDEAYQIARLGFITATQKQAPASGVSRSYEFQEQERTLSAFAQQLVSWEKKVLRFACKWEGKDPDKEMEDYTIDYPDSFDVQDLDAEIKRALDVAMLPLQATAMAAFTKQTRDAVVTLEADDKAQSDEEIDIAFGLSEPVKPDGEMEPEPPAAPPEEPAEEPAAEEPPPEEEAIPPSE